jgi:2-keto-3-deoxy-L-rhamnonate aldolase RhmA
VNWISERVRNQEVLTGTWLNLGSSLTAEMAANAGFDWVLIDLEHGAGDHPQLVHQLQAVSGTPATPIVRIAWNDPPRFKRVLDLGTCGVMVPYVNNAAEAKQAVASMCYPPRGVRGVAKMNRAAGFGEDFDAYFAKANQELLTIVQLETQEAIDNADAIAAIDGVDVLFIGPVDLSVSMGLALQFDHPKFQAALDKVTQACRKNNKTAGILSFAPDPGELIKSGFRFIAAGSDGCLVTQGMKKLAQNMNQYKQIEKP